MFFIYFKLREISDFFFPPFNSYEFHSWWNFKMHKINMKQENYFSGNTLSSFNTVSVYFILGNMVELNSQKNIYSCKQTKKS